MNNKDSPEAQDQKKDSGRSRLAYPKKYEPDPLKNKLFKADRTVMVQGRRRTGKTTFVTEMLLRHRRLYPKIFVFTKTKRNNYWQQYVPVHKIAQGIDDEVLGELIEINSERYEQWKIQKQVHGKVRGNPLTMFVFEDCVAEKEMRKALHLQTVTMNGRHHGVPCYIMSQDYVGLTPGERDNIDEWVFFRPDDERTLTMIRTTFGADVLEIAKRVWEDGRMFIINTAPRTPLQERIFWYESDLEYIEKMTHRNVVLCNKKWWGPHDPKTQKKKYPYAELSAIGTLIGEFNNDILNEEGDVEDEDTMPAIGNEDDNEKKEDKDTADSAKKVEVHVVEKSNF
mgnify:CR=1 FL=1